MSTTKPPTNVAKAAAKSGNGEITSNELVAKATHQYTRSALAELDPNSTPAKEIARIENPTDNKINGVLHYYAPGSKIRSVNEIKKEMCTNFMGRVGSSCMSGKFKYNDVTKILSMSRDALNAHLEENNTSLESFQANMTKAKFRLLKDDDDHAIKGHRNYKCVEGSFDPINAGQISIDDSARRGEADGHKSLWSSKEIVDAVKLLAKKKSIPSDEELMAAGVNRTWGAFRAKLRTVFGTANIKELLKSQAFQDVVKNGVSALPESDKRNKSANKPKTKSDKRNKSANKPKTKSDKRNKSVDKLGNSMHKATGVDGDRKPPLWSSGPGADKKKNSDIKSKSKANVSTSKLKLEEEKKRLLEDAKVKDRVIAQQRETIAQLEGYMKRVRDVSKLAKHLDIEGVE